MIEITKLVIEQDDFTLFTKLPATIHPETTTLQQALAEQFLLSPQNSFFTHATGAGFVAYKNGQPAGRIFASVDDNLVQSEGQLTGHFGFFACIDDQECAQELLRHAERWLREQNVTVVHGPVNLNIFTGYRIQMSGFDTPAFPGEPRNPTYYPRLLQNAGYDVFSTWRSWDMPNEYISLTVKLRGEGIDDLGSQGFKTRPARVENLQEEIAFLYECALDTFSENYGFATISLSEFLATYMPLQPLLDPQLFHILLDRHDSPAGFVLGYWDDPLTKQRVVFHTVAIKEAYRGEAIVYFLALPFWTGAANTGKDAVGGLAKEGKTTFDKLGPASRTYSILSKAL